MARTVVWTVVAVVTQPNAPLDTVEWVTWGRQWQLGYLRHPPLTAWIADVAFRAGGLPAVYFTGCSLVALCLWCAWRIARRLVSPALALLSVLVLDGLVFFTHRSGEFNNNLVANGLWALALLLFVHAVDSGRPAAWVGAGAAAGAGILAKYVVGVLLLAMLLVMLVEPPARRRWRSAGPYLAAAAGVAVVLPHVVWLVANDWAPVAYALGRTAGEDSWAARHLERPLKFLVGEVLRAAPAALVLALLLSPSTRWTPAEPRRRAERRMLLWLVLGPIAVFAALALGGRVVRTDYAGALWTFVPACVLAYRTPAAARSSRRAVAAWMIVVIGSVAAVAVGNLATPWIRGRPSRIHFPGRALAAAVEREWQARFPRPLPIAAGDWWLAGNVSVYGAGRIAVYGSAYPDIYLPEPRATGWVDDAALRLRGGMLLWDAARWGDGIPADLGRRYPDARPLAPLALPHHGGRHLPPARIGIALISPNDSAR